jgi:hypothetical protein
VILGLAAPVCHLGTNRFFNDWPSDFVSIESLGTGHFHEWLVERKLWIVDRVGEVLLLGMMAVGLVEDEYPYQFKNYGADGRPTSLPVTLALSSSASRHGCCGSRLV